jgi:zinc and cadmium transporter
MVAPVFILFLGPLIGVLLNRYFKNKTGKLIGNTVLFSGSFLLGIALFGLMPELFDNIKQAGIWLAVGFFFQIVLEKFTGGLGHGHVHKEDFPKDATVLFIGLYIHALLEGYSAGLSNHLNPDILSGMVIGISIHEIPATFALTVLLSTKYKNRKILYSLLIWYMLATPLGYSMGIYFHQESLISEYASQIITAIIAGTFLHISTTIVFENSLWKKEGLKKWIIILLGLTISYVACMIG